MFKTFFTKNEIRGKEKLLKSVGFALFLVALVASIAVFRNDTRYVSAASVTLPDMNKIAEIESGINLDTSSCAGSGNYVATDKASFESALQNVQPGGTICIPKGTTITGRFKLPNKNNTAKKYITIRSDAKISNCTLSDPDCLEPKIRVIPSRDQAKLAKIVTNANFAIELADGASYYKLVGLDIGSTGDVTNLVQLGDPCIGTNNAGKDQYCPTPKEDLSKIPHHIIIDRSYIHGPPTSDVGAGVVVNANYVGIANSDIREVHAWRNGDTQAINIYNSLGQILVQNNFLEGAGENIMIGGGENGLARGGQFNAANITRDVVIRGNHIWKNAARRSENKYEGPAASNRYYSKNIFELKWGQNILFEGNVLENFFISDTAQQYAIIFKSSNQGCKQSLKNVQTHDVTMRYNLLENVASAIQIARYSACSYLGSQPNSFYFATEGTTDIYTHNNLVIGLGYFQGRTEFYNPDGVPDIDSSPTEALGASNQIIEHNTVAKPLKNSAEYLSRAQAENPAGSGRIVKVPNLTFKNNVVGYTSTVGQGGILNFLPNLQFEGNVIIGNQSMFPEKNKMVSGYDGTVATNGRLLISYNGTDGRPAGADITLLEDCIGGVKTGRWNGCNVPDVQEMSVDLTASPNPVTPPATQTTLTWVTSSNPAPTSCVGSGDWSEPSLNPAGGTKVITGLTPGNHNYTITCKKSGMPDAVASENVAVVDSATQSVLSLRKMGGGTGAVASNPAGIDCRTMCVNATAVFSKTATVRLTANASPGSRFTGWGGACTGTGECSVSMSEARDVTATFETINTNICSADFNKGSTVTLKAVPGAGSTFEGWEGACTGTGECRVTMSEAKNVQARFERIPTPDTVPPVVYLTYPLNNSLVPGGSIPVSASIYDDVGVAKAEFFIDGVLKFTDTTEPYEYAWDINAQGLHSVTVKGYDTSGNSSGVASNVIITASTGQCTGPSNLPSGYAAPCPVLQISSKTVVPNTPIVITVTPERSASYPYILKTFFISDTVNACPNGATKIGGAWCPYTLEGPSASTNPEYLSQGSYILTAEELEKFSAGEHGIVTWDWQWDDSCFVGPEGGCGEGKWRLQVFSK